MRALVPTRHTSLPKFGFDREEGMILPGTWLLGITTRPGFMANALMIDP